MTARGSDRERDAQRYRAATSWTTSQSRETKQQRQKRQTIVRERNDVSWTAEEEAMRAEMTRSTNAAGLHAAERRHCRRAHAMEKTLSRVPSMQPIRLRAIAATIRHCCRTIPKLLQHLQQTVLRSCLGEVTRQKQVCARRPREEIRAC